MLHHQAGRILIAAHRGISGANIPCNTHTAFQIALSQGADIVELDIAESLDGQLFVFHPGMERAHLGIDQPLNTLTAAQIQTLRYVNMDNVPTGYGVMKLADALDFLKNKVWINVDKFWRHIEKASCLIRQVGVAEQVIVKTPANEIYLEPMKEFANDLAYIPTVRQNDDFLDCAFAEGIRLVGIEALFETEDNTLVSDAYIDALHKRGLMIFGNAIVYDERKIISAGHTDDVALAGDPHKGWGWFADKKFDIIQTDWCQLCREYLHSR